MNEKRATKERPHRWRIRMPMALGTAMIFALASVPSVAQATFETLYVNTTGVIQNQVLSSSTYTLVGGAVNIALPGLGWYGVQHGRTVGTGGTLGGTYGQTGIKTYWENAQATGHADVYWTWPTYDGYKASVAGWVVRP